MTRSALYTGGTAAAAWLLAGCMMGGPEPTTSSTGDKPSFEEFEAATYHEPWEHGVYIVNGDTPVEDIKALREFWEELYGGDGALIVHTSGGVRAVWNSTQKLNITYCVSNNFSGNKTAAVNAMTSAANAWESVANVNFIHDTSQDSNCTATNTNVVFDVRPVNSGGQYLARAFFPNNSRSSRNVLIDNSAFGNINPWTLAGILRHELGHTLGWRHEHTRPEAGTCFEDNNWEALTTYDSSSVMHYPQCNGTQNGDLVITTKDAQGAASVYGSPGGDPPPDDPPPDDPPPPDGEQTGTADGSVAQGQFVYYQGIPVAAGSRFTVVMSGTGDPDLYVRWNQQPTRTRFNCRPYLDGPNETCALDVPSNASTAHIGVRGYTAGTYHLDVTWTGP